MSVSGYSQQGGYPMSYPGTAPQQMSTSFTSPPSGYGSKPNVFPTADTSMVQLLPVTSSVETNTDYLHPMIATIMFPVLGLISWYHTHQARQHVKKGNKVRANYHVQKSNTYYGYGLCIGLAFWMFVIGVLFVIAVHALINRRHYSVSQPGKFMNSE